MPQITRCATISSAVTALEIVAHRVIWGIGFLFVFLLFRDRGQVFRRLRLPPRTVAVLAVSGSLVVFNWLVFVWAVVNDQVLATSLGYFINPLVNVLLGFLFLRERLSPAQTVAVAIAAAGTAYLAWFLGHPPWVSLLLAFSFGCYGLVRKRLPVGPLTGLMWEVLLLLPAALGYLAWLAYTGRMDFLHVSTRVDILLLLAGLVTVLPLLWFNMAAQRLALSVVGFFQYIAPTITFLLAVFFWNESFTQGHAVAFASIWTALALISMEQFRNMHKNRRARASHG